MSSGSSDVDQYLAEVLGKDRAALEKLRKTIKAAAPKATEGISYQVPMFKHEGPLVSFAAFKKHLSFILQSPPLMKTIAKDLEGYDVSGTTIRFTSDKPLPAALVRKLVKARIAENEARKKR
jgi:uncharacterized protein YdhG (YjbR/CyaY superfamily)